MRALDYLITTAFGLFLAYVIATPAAHFVEQSFNNAAERLKEMNGNGR